MNSVIVQPGNGFCITDSTHLTTLLTCFQCPILSQRHYPLQHLHSMESWMEEV